MLKKNIKNLVFMGMGEPLDNFSQVKKAIEVLTDQKGLDFAHSHITLSTAGIPDMISCLGKLNWPGLNLAVSLNAPNDEIRSWLMPVNKSYPMEELKKDLLNYPLKNKGFFFIEYVLIPGVNDSLEHARQVADYLAPMNIRLNLIPLNKTSRFGYPSTSDEDVHRFAGYLESFNVFVRKRWSRGNRLAAGCGQLGNS
jgi:23S rRNA (adenine2503-C2)-methyltransferase